MKTKFRVAFGYQLICLAMGIARWSNAADRPDEPYLTQDEASFRKDLVDDLRYHLDFNFVLADRDQVQGILDLTFTLKKEVPADRPLTLDNERGQLKTITINDRPVTVTDVQKKTYIVLPTAALKVGPNHVEIHFNKDLKEADQGLYKMVDATDQRTYIYSDLEPYKAHMIFPSFDQPDLKAKFSLIVSAPLNWKVITNTTALSVDPHGRSTHNPVRWTFKESAPMSTYLFALHVGEYQVWSSNAGTIPLRLFARQSLASHIDPNEWFDLTKAGLAYYQKYNGFDYPFEKYDQIIVPDFLWGGMENIGAVTFSEKFVALGEKTTAEKAHLANVLLHEMAHMWFGDLVTMSWWNDLWLNESFADFMAAKSVHEATPYSDTWISESFSEKPWAYAADGFSTTHPISGSVGSTAVALANFDGITYGKGGAALKQLNFLLGDAAFETGIQAYFKKHQFGNATLGDFLAELELASGRDLKEWSKQWLESAGTNVVSVALDCDDHAKIRSLRLVQKIPATGDAQLRQHKTRVALFTDKDTHGAPSDVVTVAKVFDVELSESADLSAAVGLDCPLLVQPNYQDYAFFRTELDARTVAALPTNLHKITDPQARALFWINLWSMVQGAQFSLEEFIDVVANNIAFETDPQIAHYLADFLEGLRWGTAETYAQRAPAELQSKLSDTLESLYWSRALESQAVPPDWKAWFSLYVDATESAAGGAQLFSIVKRDSGAQFQTLLDQDLRWKILQRLSVLGTDDSQIAALLELEKAADPSRRGVLAYEAATSMRPVVAIKQDRLQRLTNDMTIVAGDLEAYVPLFSSNQGAIFDTLMETSYQTLINNLGKRDDQFLGRLVDATMPLVCTSAHLQRAEQLLAQNGAQMTPVTLKAVKESRDRLKTCVNVKVKKTLAKPPKNWS